MEKSQVNICFELITRANSRWKQQSDSTNFSNNFDSLYFRIGVIFNSAVISNLSKVLRN